MTSLTLAATELTLRVAQAPLDTTPSPTVTPHDDLTPSQQAAPGVWAFVAFLFLAVALWLLMRNMNARLRRMSYRAKTGQPDESAAGRVIAEDDGSATSARGAADASGKAEGDSGAAPTARS